MLSEEERSKKIINVHLVSDSTAETVQIIYSSITSQFTDVTFQSFIWPVVNKESRIKTAIKAIQNKPGIILYTISDQNLCRVFEQSAKEIEGCTIIPGVDYVMMKFSEALGVAPSHKIGSQHQISKEYFERIEAINYTHEHDDGRLTASLNEADIVLIGVSRTSKTPTSAYLSHRGYKVANVPLVNDMKQSIEILKKLTKPMIIGLTISANRLLEIRRARMQYIGNVENSTYIDLDQIKQEIKDAQKYFNLLKCHTIDVTNRSVEETAAHIIRFYQIKKSLD